MLHSYLQDCRRQLNQLCQDHSLPQLRLNGDLTSRDDFAKCKLIQLGLRQNQPFLELDEIKIKLLSSEQLSLVVELVYSGTSTSFAQVEALLQLKFIRPSLGRSLRWNGYHRHPLSSHQDKIKDFSLATLASTVLSLARSKEERQRAKDLVLASIDEAFTFQFMCLPTTLTLSSELFYLETSPYPSGEASRSYTFTRGNSGKPVMIQLPRVLWFSPQALGLIQQWIEADLVLTSLLWRWFGVTTCSSHELLVASLTPSTTRLLGDLKHPIDPFLGSFEEIVTATLGNLLLSRCLELDPSLIPAGLYLKPREEFFPLLAESLSSTGVITLEPIKAKLAILAKQRQVTV